MRAAGVQADEVTCNTLRKASVVSDIATRSTSPQVMDDEAELAPALGGSVPTLDSVETGFYIMSHRQGHGTQLYRCNGRRLLRSSPGHSVSKGSLLSWCHIFHCVARRHIERNHNRRPGLTACSVTVRQPRKYGLLARQTVGPTVRAL